MLLEHLHARVDGNEKCPNPSAPKLLGVNRETKSAIYVSAACKQWSCPVCGKRKVGQWVARVLVGINHYHRQGFWQWYLMTITSHENHRGVDASLANLRQGWRKLSNRMWRAFGKCHYVRVFEHHADGSFHMHVIADIKIPYTTRFKWNDETRRLEPVFACKWLKDNARECGMGYMDDYRPIANPGIAAWYTVKYLSKSIGDNSLGWPKNMRRIQTSHKWPSLPEMTDASQYEWQYVANRSELLLRAKNLWLYEDILVTDVASGEEINLDQFGFWDM